MKTKYIKSIIILLLIPLFLTGCLIEIPDNDEEGKNEQKITFDENEGADLILDFTIEMENYKFSPNVIEANAGDILSVRVRSKQGTHDFVIDDLNTRTDRLDTGVVQLIEIEIPEDAQGKTYEFYCSVGNHKQLGMTGTLKIN